LLGGLWNKEDTVVPRDYFNELDWGLDRKKTREENLQSLKARYNRVRNRSDGLAEQEKLKEALKVFTNEAAYQEYLAELRREERNRAKGEKTRERREAQRSQELQRELEAERQRRQEAERLAQRSAEKARLQALQVEEAKRREAERSRELQRELDTERERRIAQEEQAKRPIWAELGLKLVDRLLKPAKQPDTSTHTPVHQSLRPVTIDPTGDWIDDNGTPISLWQNAGLIRWQEKNSLGQIVANGVGQFDGRNFRMQYQTTLMGIIPMVGEVWGEVSEDGNSIRSQGIGPWGQAFGLNLRRVTYR
jgi:hypothetical protein